MPWTEEDANRALELTRSRIVQGATVDEAGAIFLPRLADGPEEVHWFVVGRAELSRWVEGGASEYDPKQNYLAGQDAGTRFTGP